MYGKIWIIQKDLFEFNPTATTPMYVLFSNDYTKKKKGIAIGT